MSDLITIFPFLGFHFYTAVTEAGKVGDRLSVHNNIYNIKVLNVIAAI